MSSTNQPRTRQRAYKAPPQLNVPDIEDDAAERKRVLNVLAQRRYREKKRQRRKQQSHEKDDGGENTIAEVELLDEAQTVFDQVISQGPAVGIINAIDNDWASTINSTSIAPLLVGANLESDFTQGNIELGIYPSSPTWPGDVTSLELFTSSSNAGSPPSFGTSPDSVSSDGTFADSYLLPVHELKLLSGLMRIAERLGCTEDLWSPTTQSPFTRGGGTPAEQLPPTWQPTTTQILLPHHPFLDFLPWPSVRDKVIGIFSLPDQARPPSAAGPLGLANLAYDIEDNSEGVRIYGEDPYDPSCWEVGQVIFQRWWFLFDRDIIATSNRWRRLRGAPPLALTDGGEAGSK